MKFLRTMFALFACAALLFAGVATAPTSRAAENEAPGPPEFPAYTNVQDMVWYCFEVFVEGEKAGFGKWTLSKVKVGEKEMLLVQQETDYVRGPEGTERSRALADAETMQILFAEETQKYEGLERFGFVECSYAGKEATLKYYNKVGDKALAREEKHATDSVIYPADLTLYAYAQTHLNAESRAQEQRLYYASPLKGSIDVAEIEFVGIENAKVSGKEVPFGSVKTEGYKKMLIDRYGAIIRSLTSDGVKFTRLSDAENYKKTPAKPDDYEMPAFLKDDTAELKDFGVSIARPDKTWMFSFSPDMPIFSVNRFTGTGGVSVTGMAFLALPEGAAAADLSARMALLLKLAPDSEVVFGEAREIEVNGMKGIEGDVTAARHAEVIKGRYRAFVKDGRGVCMMLSAYDFLLENVSGDLEKIASSFRFLDGAKREGDPVMKEPKFGVELTIPGDSWAFDKMEKDSITARSAWWFGNLYFASFPKSDDVTLNSLRDNAKQGLPNRPGSTLKDVNTTKICDYDAVVAEYEYTDKLTRGPAVSVWVVYVLRQDTLVAMSCGTLVEYRDRMNADLEKILKAIKLTEPVKEEEKPGDDEIN